MKNLFDASAQREVYDRLCLLKKDKKANWGRMDAAQMLAHCCEFFRLPLMDKAPPPMLIGRLVGWAIRSQAYNDRPMPKNLPTAPKYKFTDHRDFETERKELIRLIDKFFVNGPERVHHVPHPLFGKFSAEQWGKYMYKHLDHHLRQFGV